MPQVIIVGAGVAGLCAAIKLKKHNIDYVILEASGEIGGRARSMVTPLGNAVDLGAHWFHGKYNPLKQMFDDYKIPYALDEGDMYIYNNGVGRKVGDDWLEDFIDKKKAKAIKKGELADCSMPELAINNEGKYYLENFARTWDGLLPPLQPSAHEYLTDKSTPDGLQIKGGLGLFLNRLLEDAGKENLVLNCAVTEIFDDGIKTADGKIWPAQKVIFTGSLGVIKSGVVKFNNGLSLQFQNHLAQIAMGEMNKIIIEVNPQFFIEKKIDKELSIEIIDDESAHFCHVKSAGNPIITLFVSSERAAMVENMSAEESLDYMRKVLAPVKEIKGYEDYIQGKPIVTNWVGNPYIQGSYSACLPGGKRDWLKPEGNIYFCGDTFDADYPASMAGAFRSAKASALLVAETLNNI